MEKMKTEASQQLVEQVGNLVEEFETFEEFEKHLENEQKEALKAAQRPTFLWAEIKKSSKYFGQTKGKFQVCVQDHEYCLKGGVGVRYRPQDVNLFAKVGEEFVTLP